MGVFNLTFIYSSKDYVKMGLIIMISGTLFDFFNTCCNLNLGYVFIPEL